MRGDSETSPVPAPLAGPTLAETNSTPAPATTTPTTAADLFAARSQASSRGLRFQFRPVGIVPVNGATPTDAKGDPKLALDNASGATANTAPSSPTAPLALPTSPSASPAGDNAAALRSPIKPGNPQLAVTGESRSSMTGGTTGSASPTATLPSASPVTSTPTTTLYSTPASTSPSSPNSASTSTSTPGSTSSTLFSTPASTSNSASTSATPASSSSSTSASTSSTAPLSLATTDGSSGTTTASSGTTPPATASTLPATASSLAPSGTSLASTAAGSNVAASAMARAANAVAAPTAVADAYVNFANGPYPDAANLLTGDPKSWTTSPVVTRLFGGSAPTIQDQAAFAAKVASTVSDTYKQAGVPIRVTTDPGVPAAHTLSVVSGATATASPSALGIASVGYNGFTLIDQFTPAQNVSDLATAVGHNVAHELMHTFGVADHPEASGDAVDAATTTWSSLTDPNASFSQPAANLLSTLDLDATGSLIASNAAPGTHVDGAQQIDPVPVPEPGAVVVWLVAGAVGVVVARRRLA